MSSVVYQVLPFFAHYLSSSTIVGNISATYNMFCFSVQYLRAEFLVLRRIHGDIIINLHTALRKITLFLFRFY
jgi:hypothetical protein